MGAVAGVQPEAGAAVTECIHGLEADWCATCKHGPDVKPPLKVAATFFARYPGDCRACSLPIVAGEAICLLSDDSYVHDGCRP